MRMCTFSTPTSWCLNSSEQGSRTACRFIPMSATASGVLSLESIMRLRCCTSSSRTSDEPFYTLTFPPRFLPSSPRLLVYIPPFIQSCITSCFIPFQNLLSATDAKPHLKSCLSVLTVLKHLSINSSLQYWNVSITSVNSTITEQTSCSILSCVWQSRENWWDALSPKTSRGHCSPRTHRSGAFWVFSVGRK